MVLDAHSHLKIEQLRECQQKGIDGWVMGGVEPEEWKRQLEMKALFPKQIYPVFGVHPWWVHTASPKDIEQALEKLEDFLPQAVALGETGLDAFKEKAATLEKQKEVFKIQVQKAEKHRKPLVLHIVQAHAEAQEVLKGTYSGIIHSFSGKENDAKAYCARGFHISVSGTILRKGYEGLKGAVRALPLGKFVIETDSESPLQLPLIAEEVAKLKGLSKEEVLEVSTENVKKIFGL